MERRMRGNSHVRCGAGEKTEITSNSYLLLYSRQYLSNYHLLETAAKYDYPKVKGITGQREYENQKSAFCSKKTVDSAFLELIKNAKFKHIILSYSNDGIMNIEQIENIMKQYGKPETYYMYEISYRKYKNKKSIDGDNLKEFLFYIEK